MSDETSKTDESPGHRSHLSIVVQLENINVGERLSAPKKVSFYTAVRRESLDANGMMTIRALQAIAVKYLGAPLLEPHTTELLIEMGFIAHPNPPDSHIEESEGALWILEKTHKINTQRIGLLEYTESIEALAKSICDQALVSANGKSVGLQDASFELARVLGNQFSKMIESAAATPSVARNLRTGCGSVLKAAMDQPDPPSGY